MNNKAQIQSGTIVPAQTLSEWSKKPNRNGGDSIVLPTTSGGAGLTGAAGTSGNELIDKQICFGKNTNPMKVYQDANLGYNYTKNSLWGLGSENANLGNNSLSFHNGLASGGNSFCFGANNNTANANYAVSFGQGCLATNTNAFALGFGASASANRSLAFTATASGNNSLSLCNSGIASGSSAAAICGGSAIGNNSLTTNGNGLATGQYSISMGNGCTASAFAAMAINSTNTASQAYSLAAGFQNTSSGFGSVSFGSSVVSSNDYSFGSGISITASGKYSAVFGYSSTGSNDGVAATGVGAIASGNCANAHGLNVTAQGHLQHVVGTFNALQGTANSITATDRIEIVGNGPNWATRQNARALQYNGIHIFKKFTSAIVAADFGALAANEIGLGIEDVGGTRKIVTYDGATLKRVTLT